MKFLNELSKGDQVEVKKLVGDRNVKKEFQNMGISTGLDIEVLEKNTDGSMKVRAGHKELTLTAEQAAAIGTGEQLKRNNDPILFGCGGGGMDRVEAISNK